MRKIKRIMCCCGSGLGSSMFMEMNIQKVLNDLGIKNVTVFHGSITEIDPYVAEIFVAGRDVEPILKKYKRVIILNDLISYEEAREKIKKAFENVNEEFFID